MTNAQKWTTLILSFILVFTLVAGGYAFGSLKSVERILSTPATTSEFDVTGNFSISNELNGANLTITHISGKVNSKVLDLILLAINN